VKPGLTEKKDEPEGRRGKELGDGWTTEKERVYGRRRKGGGTNRGRAKSSNNSSAKEGEKGWPEREDLILIPLN